MTDAHGVARDQLRAFVERIERLEEEKKTIADDIKDVYGEAKSMGFDTKILKKVIALRKKDDQERTEEELILDTYMQALGMIPDFEAETASAEVRVERSRGATSAPLQMGSETISEQPVTAKGQAAGSASGLSTNPVANVEEEEANGAIAAASNDPASRTDEGGERQHSSTVGFTGDCRTEGKEQLDASAASVGDAAADAQGIPAISSRVDSANSGILAEDTRSDANTGGDHVDLDLNAAQNQAGGVSSAPATSKLRPNCLNPGCCASGTRDHCHTCKKAMAESEAA
jgi:uncharacterized protein (UPF0335 family)